MSLRTRSSKEWTCAEFRLAANVRKGQEYVKEFMDTKFKLVYPQTQDASQLGNSFPEIANFISKVSSTDGVKRVLLVFTEVAKRLFCVRAQPFTHLLPQAAAHSSRVFAIYI